MNSKIRENESFDSFLFETEVLDPPSPQHMHHFLIIGFTINQIGGNTSNKRKVTWQLHMNNREKYRQIFCRKVKEKYRFLLNPLAATQ